MRINKNCHLKPSTQLLTNLKLDLTRLLEPDEVQKEMLSKYISFKVSSPGDFEVDNDLFPGEAA